MNLTFVVIQEELQLREQYMHLKTVRSPRMRELD
jgi:hypothetical protein